MCPEAGCRWEAPNAVQSRRASSISYLNSQAVSNAFCTTRHHLNRHHPFAGLAGIFARERQDSGARSALLFLPLLQRTSLDVLGVDVRGTALLSPLLAATCWFRPSLFKAATAARYAVKTAAARLAVALLTPASRARLAMVRRLSVLTARPARSRSIASCSAVSLARLTGGVMRHLHF
jgi:hypothetical protein